jgi:hypothetical protein
MCTKSHYLIKCEIPSAIGENCSHDRRALPVRELVNNGETQEDTPQKLVRFGKSCPLEGKSALPVVRFAETAEISHVKIEKHIFTRKKEHVRNTRSQNKNPASGFAS